MGTTTELPITLKKTKSREKRRFPGGVVLLIALIGLVAYGVYLYQFKPLITMRVPEHQPLPIDTPPVELTSFQVRANGEDLTPNSIAIEADSIYVSFVGKPLVQIYSKDLVLLKSLTLDRPAVVVPVAVAVTDSQLIVADTIEGLIAVYDHDGDYVNSVAWYPGRKIRIRPTQLATDGKLLAVVDREMKQVAVISLISRQPYYDFLELLVLIPGNGQSRLESPSCALVVPDGRIWIGDDVENKGCIYSSAGKFISEIEQPARAKISSPIGFAVAYQAIDIASKLREEKNRPSSDNVRVHLLDKVTGKVFVYNLSGELTLVYPQDRLLREPTSIAVNSTCRQIFIVEGGSRSITVFGY